MKIGQVTAILLITIVKLASGFLRVCYYTNWSQYRPGVGKFTPDNVNPALCSHIVYAFAKLEGNALKTQEWNDESTAWTVGMYQQINNMKKKHPHLKTLIAIGGWNAGSAPFSDVAMTTASRKEFVNHTQHFLREHDFDGLDIDWEYPAQRGGRAEDKQNLVLLLKDLATAFEHDAYHTGRPKLILSAAVPAGKQQIDSGFDVPNVARSLDFINVMAYDLHGSWESTTGHNSPLFARATETGAEATMNIEWALNYWSRLGAPKHKLIVGLGIYGRSFRLDNPLNNGIGAATIGAGRMGNLTKEDGFMAYYEVCQELSQGAVRVWNDEHKVPYMYNGDLWVGYDDEQSVREKVKWTRQQGFGGMMVWSLALDDFSGTMCNKGPYPLLTAINDELKRTTKAKTMDFIDPTLGGGSNTVLSGGAATPPTALLTNPPEAHAFEHRPVNGHSHHTHSSPALSNASNIDIQQLSSLPHIRLLDHHSHGASHSQIVNTTPKPSPNVHNEVSFPSQTSLADLFAELVHAPVNHKRSHHNPTPAAPGPMDAQAPTVPASQPISHHHEHSMVGSDLMDLPPTIQSQNTPSVDQTLQDLIPGTVPTQGTLGIREVGQPAHIHNSMQDPIVESRPEFQMVGSPSSRSNIDPLRALGHIGVIPAVGQLGGRIGHIHSTGDVPNISFSSSSNSSSSSSSSTSSSNSNSRNVSIGIPGRSPERLNLQDVLNSERSNLPNELFGSGGVLSPGPIVGLKSGSSIPGDSIFSILDGGLPSSQRIELPSGSVGTVIPIANDDNLAQILSSLGVSLPTTNDVLLPEESIVLTPDRILDELAIGNVLQPRVESRRLPSLQQRLPVVSRRPTVVSQLPERFSQLAPLDSQLPQQRVSQLRQQRVSQLPQRVSQLPTSLSALRTGLSQAPSASASGSQIQRRVSRLPARPSQLSTADLRAPTRVTRIPPMVSQSPAQRSLQTQGTSSRNLIQRPNAALSTIRPSNPPRSNANQRTIISLEDLIRVLERRRAIQRLRSPQPQQTNQASTARSRSQLRESNRQQQPTVSQTRLHQASLSQIGLQQPVLLQNRPQQSISSQQRLSRPAISRQQIQRVPFSQLGLRSQSNQGQAVVRRTVPEVSTNGITLLNSGNLPAEMRRMLIARG